MEEFRKKEPKRQFHNKESTRKNLTDTQWYHKNGIWWDKAPIPPRDHECEIWTSGSNGVRRCACGAIRQDNLPFDTQWKDKNNRADKEK